MCSESKTDIEQVILFIITPGVWDICMGMQARSNLTHGMSGKLILFIKIQNYAPADKSVRYCGCT